VPHFQNSFFSIAVVEVLIFQRFPYGGDSTFFYFAPNKLLSIREGDIVTVPWRRKKIKGAALRIKKIKLKSTRLSNELRLDFRALRISLNYFFRPVPTRPINLKPIEEITERGYFSPSALLGLRKASERCFVSWNHFALSAYLEKEGRPKTKKLHLPTLGQWIEKIGSIEKLIAARKELKTASINSRKPKFIFIPQNQPYFLKKLLNKCLQEKKQALIIVPEKIQTLPAAVKYYFLAAGRITETPVIISKILPPAWFKASWRLTQQLRQTIFVGNRSSLFAPFRNLGLIILEDGHNPNFKQWDMNPYYDLRDIIGFLYPKIPKIYLSSTPRLEDFWDSPFFLTEENDSMVLTRARTVKTKNERIFRDVREPVQLSEVFLSIRRLIYQGKRKKIQIVNLKKDRLLYQKDQVLSHKARSVIARACRMKLWTIILANHKGIANTIICNDCGHIPQCSRCGKNLILLERGRLHCRFCGNLEGGCSFCPKCQKKNFGLKNFGLERVKEEIAGRLKSAKIPLIIPPEPKASYEKYLDFWQKLISCQGKAAVVLGYAGIANCLWLFRESIGQAVFTSFDNLLFYPDFRSEERAAARLYCLLEIAPEITIQTSYPDHEFFSKISQGGYSSLYSGWISERKKFHYPPFGKLLKVEILGSSEAKLRAKVSRWLGKIKQIKEVEEVFPQKKNLKESKSRQREIFLLKASKNIDLGTVGKTLPIGSKVDINPENFIF